MTMIIEYDLIWHGFPHRQLSIIDGGTQKSFVVYIKASSPLLQNTEHKNRKFERKKCYNVSVTDICQIIDINDIRSNLFDCQSCTSSEKYCIWYQSYLRRTILLDTC